MAINLSAIRDLLVPGVRKITGDYKEIPQQWPMIFEKGKSNMAVERTVNMRFLPTAQIKNEGGATAFDNNAGERFVYNQEHVEIGLGYAITRKAMDDNQYKSQFKPTNLGLMKSFRQTKEILAANILNQGNVFNPQIGADGVSMINTAHPIDGTSVGNQPSVDMDLNETSIYSALMQIRQFKDNAGLKSFTRGEKLIVPVQLQYVADRLLKTELRPGTADNDANALTSTNGLPGGYVTMDFLTSPYAWFIKTDNDDGLLYLERIPFETDIHADFVTDNLLVKGYERYSFGYDDWRGIWGTFPTS